MSDLIVIGAESTTGTSVQRLAVRGSFQVLVGQHNPTMADSRLFGNFSPYHRMETVAGSPHQNGPAELADHSHITWANFRNTGVTTAGAARTDPMPQRRRHYQAIYTAGSPVDSINSVNSFLVHGGCQEIAGTVLAGDISIDTTLTSPSGAQSIGNVVFRQSVNPNVTAGTRWVLNVFGNTVAGIQAAMYQATVVTPSAETSPGSGIWEYVLAVAGLDGLHWTATAGTPGGSSQGLSTLIGNYSVAPASVLAVSSVALPGVTGDPHLLDVTLTATPPAALIVGHSFSVMLGTGTSVTGLTTDVWQPGTVVSVVGNVVRVRLGGSANGLRYRSNLTLGGTTDNDTARNIASIGVRDNQHEIVQGEILTSQYRDGNGVPQVMGFGSCIFGATVARSVACGMDLWVGDNDTWVAGTSQASNRMSLAGNVLSVASGLNIGSARYRTGAGSPEGVVTAPVGSLYTRTDGGAGTTLYVKESGTGNTGWVAK